MNLTLTIAPIPNPIEVNRGFDIDEITATLPPSLKSEVFFVVHEHLLRQVPMFEELGLG